KVVASVEVSTTGEPAAISMSVDRSSIAADRRDVAHFTIRILDEKGNVVPTAANEVTVEIQGVGKLIGMDNGDPQSHEDYKSNRRRAFNGLCLAVVQSAGTAGEIRVTATSPGLKGSNAVMVTKV